MPGRRCVSLSARFLGNSTIPWEGSIRTKAGPSIPPEQLLSALLLQEFYSIRSERQLIEQLDYKFAVSLVRRPVTGRLIWDATVFTKNRERLQQAMCSRGSWPSFSSTGR